MKGVGNPFILLGGDHVDGQGTKYNKSDVVWSTDDLIQMFPGKFRPANRQEIEEAEQKGQAQEKQARQQSFAAAGLTEDGTPKDEKKKERVKVAEEGVKVTEEGTDAESFGEDVTSEFPAARKAKVQVFHQGREWTVVDKETPEVALNTEPLRSKKQVVDFIEENAD